MSYTQWSKLYTIKFITIKAMYTRMLVQVRQCKMQTCTIHMHNANTKPRKPREAKQRPTKLTKTKVSDQKG